MQLFHIGNPRYARQLNGEGARLFGGRWNRVGSACIYTSATRSLCLLEYMANVSSDLMPSELAITEYFLPDKLCRIINVDDLPPDWNAVPPTNASKDFGADLLADETCTCFAVPSVVMPMEYNYMLNPKAVKFDQLVINAVEPFTFDTRLKL